MMCIRVIGFFSGPLMAMFSWACSLPAATRPASLEARSGNPGGRLCFNHKRLWLPVRTIGCAVGLIFGYLISCCSRNRIREPYCR